MHAVVIVAHPNPESFSHAIAARITASMRAAGSTVIVHDLCAEGFRAAMSADERAAYHGEQPVLDPLVAQHIADLQAADTLVFVYPTWWSTLPAVLKGWLERVLVPGVAFTLPAEGHVRPALTGIRRIIGISTYGSRRTYVRAVNDNGRRVLMRALRLSTGLRTRTTWLGLYAMDTRTAEDRAAFLDRVDAAGKKARSR